MTKRHSITTIIFLWVVLSGGVVAEWTPEMSKSAEKSPLEPKSPHGWYPPEKPSTTSPGDLFEKIATSNLANPLIQGGKAIGKAYEAADRGDNMGAAIEAADGFGRLVSIGAGAGKGAAIGTSIAGPLGTVIGGIVGGFIGNKGWEYTGGMINEKNREMLQELNARQQAEMQRQNMPRGGSRPSGGGGGGDCGRH